MRFLAPAAIVGAGLLALWLTPPGRPLLGLSHEDFARGALGVAMLTWLVSSGVARAGSAGAARVLTGATVWAVLAFILVGGYAYRYEFSDIASRVIEELGPSVVRNGASGEVTIRRRYGGEFIVPGKVNGRATEFVFDTGASAVVLSAEDAASAGLSFTDEDYGIDVTTANGATTAAPARLERVEVGGIVVRGVRGLVARPGALRQSLLGMSFLERLKGFRSRAAS